MAINKKKSSPIPFITNEELLKRATKIELVAGQARDMHNIDSVVLRNQIWGFGKKPGFQEKAEYLGKIETYRTSRHCVPSYRSVAEVLSQMPEEHLDKAVAFSTEIFNENILDALTQDQKHHIAVTSIYAGKLPEDVKNQKLILKS